MRPPDAGGPGCPRHLWRTAQDSVASAGLRKGFIMLRRACGVLGLLLAVVVAVTGSSAASSAGTGAPTPIDLGTLGGTNSAATGISDTGEVVGQSQVRGDAQWHGFAWTPGGGIVDIPTLGG